jgi:MFS family permease
LQRSTEPAVRPVAARNKADVGHSPAVRADHHAGTDLRRLDVRDGRGNHRCHDQGAWPAGRRSFVIGVYAIGSFVVGLVLGALNLRTPLQKQLLIAVSVLAVTALPLLIAGTVPLLALAVFVSGIAISPTFITAFGLIERRVPESMLTEGVTWVMTGIGIGMALGAFLAGWVVDNFGAQNGFWLSVAAGAAVVVTIGLGQKTLAGGRPETAGDALPQAAE